MNFRFNSMKWMKAPVSSLLLIMAGIFLPNLLLGQNKIVQGVVTEEETGNPLVGATVHIKDGTTGTLTNEDGTYQLVVNDEDAVLVFSFAGRESAEVPVTGQSQINVALKTRDNMLQEVNIGYMRQQKKDLTGAVAMADADEISKNLGSNAMKALQGKLAGVYVMTNGGNPTEQVNIQIRGVTSLSGAVQPLIVMDGMPMEGLNLNDINAHDIESIQVLKDAASASIYGARASGGVILIDTKKGKLGRTTVTYEGSVGMAKVVNKPEIMDARGYGIMAFRAAAYDEKTFGTALTPALPTNAYEYTWHRNADGLAILDDLQETPFLDPQNLVPASNTDWLKQVLKTAVKTSHQLAISSGTERSRSYFSLGFYNNEGTQIYTSYRKYSFRANNDYDLIKDRLKIGEDMTMIYEHIRDRDQQYAAMIMPPAVPVYDINGNWAGAAGFDDFSNPVRVLTNDKGNYNHYLKTITNLYADLKIWNGISARTQFGLDYTEGYDRRIDKKWSETGARSSDDENYVGNDQWHRIDYVWTNTLSYQQSFGEHHINAVAGSEYTRYVYEEFNARREGIYLEDRDFAGLSVATGSKQSMGSGADEYTYFSLFAKANYDYNNRYLLSATIRRDGSSLFGKNNRFGIFPAASAGWRISEEPFLSDAGFISDLKIRASWGENGSVQGLPRGYTTTPFSPNYSATAYPIQGNETGQLESGYYRVWIGNPDLKWETTTQTDLGVDFSLFERKLSGSFDYYHKKTTDILVQTPYIAAMGEGGEPWINGASMQNNGIEFDLTYRSSIGKDFNYSISANGGTYKTKILDIPSDVINKYPGDGGKDNVIGMSPNVIYGLVADGIFKTQEDVSGHASQVGAAVGRIRYRDVNGDGRIDELTDRAYVGFLDPKFFGGITFNANYHNFDLNFFFQGLFGADVYDQWKYESDLWGITLPSGKNHPTRLYDAWYFDNQSSDIPAASNNTANHEERTSSYYVESGSYLKLRNIELGYTVPAQLSRKMSMQKLRAYVSAKNVLTLKKSWGDNQYTSFDPEMHDYGYLIPFELTFGINVTF